MDMNPSFPHSAPLLPEQSFGWLLFPVAKSDGEEPTEGAGNGAADCDGAYVWAEVATELLQRRENCLITPESWHSLLLFHVVWGEVGKFKSQQMDPNHNDIF